MKYNMTLHDFMGYEDLVKCIEGMQEGELVSVSMSRGERGKHLFCAHKYADGGIVRLFSGWVPDGGDLI